MKEDTEKKGTENAERDQRGRGKLRTSAAAAKGTEEVRKRPAAKGRGKLRTSDLLPLSRFRS